MKNYAMHAINTLLAANTLLILLTIVSVFDRCRSPENALVPTISVGAGQADSLTAAVPRPARRYVDAVNRNNLDSLVLAFAPTGAVVDVSRRIEGRDAIRTWAQNEVMGGTLRVLAVEQQRPDQVRLLVHWAPRGAAGWRAYYTFTYASNGVTLADLQYA